ncbi:hypothetical protein ACOKFD_03170 [Flagellimonas sp. S174]|uniref:hypothetical protein n=1 Tax=Flagellimonas sp. S174 TaxID=3410790 RepID=UPI003BF49187
MSKNVINFIATIVLAALFSLFLPWWSVMTAALVTSLFLPLKKAAVFFVPFLGVLLFWAVYCIVLSSANDFALAKKISQLLQIGGNPFLLILITGIVGGLAAGMTAIFGKQIVALGSKK